MSEQEPDPRPGKYWVSVVDGTRYAFLSGPYVNNHAGALQDLGECRRVLLEQSARAHWYSFGTARTELDNPEPAAGILNRQGLFEISVSRK